MAYKVAIFDYDGTLADSKQAILATMAHALRQADGGDIAPHQVADWIGLPLERMIEQLLLWSGRDSETRRAQVLDAYRAAYSDLCTQHTRLFDGMRGVLDRAKAAGLKLAVATSKSRLGLTHSGSNLGILPLFDAVRTADDVVEHKPHPEMLHSILAQLQLQVADAVMIGDTVYDMEMGRRAGMDTIAVTYGAHDVARLQTQHPTYMVSAAADLWPIIGR